MGHQAGLSHRLGQERSSPRRHLLIAGAWLRRRGLKRKTVTGIAAGTWEDRYLVAKFTRRVGELPLHPVLTAEWFRAAGLSHQDGSGGSMCAALPLEVVIRST
jgi:hypothetical protein